MVGFEGIVPELLAKYRNTKSAPHLRGLEKYMNTVDCTACHGERLLPQARFVRMSTASDRFADFPAKSLPQVCKLSVSDAAEFFSVLTLDATSQHIATEVLKEIRGRIGF